VKAIPVGNEERFIGSKSCCDIAQAGFAYLIGLPQFFGAGFGLNN
jgi:hypothetical protein